MYVTQLRSVSCDFLNKAYKLEVSSTWLVRYYAKYTDDNDEC